MKSRIMTVSISEMFRRYVYLIIFILGLVFGTFIINIMDNSYYSKINVIQDYYIEMVNDVVVNKNDMFKNGIIQYFKEFVIILIFNCFFFGKIYNAVYLAVKGAGIGIIISSYVMKYGIKGVIVYVASIFPHYIIYIPAVILTICAGISMRNIILQNNNKGIQYSKNEIAIRDVLKIIKKLVVYFLIILFFAVVISIVESYINLPLLKNSI